MDPPEKRKRKIAPFLNPKFMKPRKKRKIATPVPKKREKELKPAEILENFLLNNVREDKEVSRDNPSENSMNGMAIPTTQIMEDNPFMQNSPGMVQTTPRKFFQMDFPEAVESKLRELELNNFSVFLLEKNLKERTVAMAQVCRLLEQIKIIERECANPPRSHLQQTSVQKLNYATFIPRLNALFLENSNVSNRRKCSFFVSETQERKWGNSSRKTQQIAYGCKVPVMGITIGRHMKNGGGGEFDIRYDSVTFENPCRVNHFRDASFLLKVKIASYLCTVDQSAQNREIRERSRDQLLAILQGGINVLNSRFVFLSTPTSGPKTKVCYFYQASELANVNAVVFNRIRTKDGKPISDPMKMLKRRALNFTKCIPTISIPKSCIVFIPDVLRVDPKYNPALHGQVISALKFGSAERGEKYARDGEIGKRQLVELITANFDKTFDDKYLHCYTDGCGLIGVNLLRRVMERYRQHFIGVVVGESNTSSPSSSSSVPLQLPAVIQVRFLGCKGTLVVDHRKGFENRVCLRESQLKYDMDVASTQPFERILYVHSICKPRRSAMLNTQLVQHLEERGIPRDYFLQLQEHHYQNIRTEIHHLRVGSLDTAQILRKLRLRGVQIMNNNNSESSNTSEPALRKLLAGFDFREPTLRHDLYKVAQRLFELHYSAKNHKKFVKIEIPKSRYYFGVPDHMNVLKEGEIFMKMSIPNVRRGTVGGKGGFSGEVITSEVILCKMPIVHAHDIRLVRAVNRREFSHLTDCIVFNTHGNIPLSVSASRGDYDGDEFLVIFDPVLVRHYKRNQMKTEGDVDVFSMDFNVRMSQMGMGMDMDMENKAPDKIPSSKSLAMSKPTVVVSQNNDYIGTGTTQQQPTMLELIRTFVTHDAFLLSFFSDLLVRYIDRYGYEEDTKEKIIPELYKKIQNLMDMKKDHRVTKGGHFAVLDERLGVPDFLAQKRVYEKKNCEKYKSEKVLGLLYRKYLENAERLKTLAIQNQSYDNIQPIIPLNGDFLPGELNVAVSEIKSFCNEYRMSFQLDKPNSDAAKKRVVWKYRKRFVEETTLKVNDNGENKLWRKTRIFYKVVFSIYENPRVYPTLSIHMVVFYMNFVLLEYISQVRYEMNKDKEEAERRFWVLDPNVAKKLYLQ